MKFTICSSPELAKKCSYWVLGVYENTAPIKKGQKQGLIELAPNTPSLWAKGLELFTKPQSMTQNASFLLGGKVGDHYDHMLTDGTVLHLVVIQKKEQERVAVRNLVANTFAYLKNRKIPQFGLWLPSFTKDEMIGVVAISLMMTNYDHTSYKTDPKYQICYNPDVYLGTESKKSKEHLLSLETLIHQAKIIGSNVNIARDLSNEPPNICHAQYLTDELVQFVKKSKHIDKRRLHVEVWNKSKIRKEKMNLLLAVNAGSAYEPRVILFNYKPSKKKKTQNSKHIFLVGKGITFDTGGYSLKPAASMVNMKYDMCGAVNCVMSFLSAIELDSPHEISCIVGITDNVVSALATFPDSVIKSRNGKTVEINNTDAEGRLVLADLFDVACEYNPSEIIDMATLTGAAARFLGPVAAVLSNHKPTLSKFLQTTSVHDEPMMEVLTFDFYNKDLKSNIADMKNSAGPTAGTQTAFLFLQNFIKNKKDSKEKIPWIHLDIAGLSDNVSFAPYCPHSGASGLMIRSLVEYLMHS